MLRNLVLSITKEQLIESLGPAVSVVKEVRLIQNREGSKNYAFLEFQTTNDAIKWMQVNEVKIKEREGIIVNGISLIITIFICCELL
jgi:RNA recognition motif-containing protein